MNPIFSGKYVFPFSVAAIVLVAGGIFVWSQTNQAPAEPNAQPTPSPTSQPTKEIPEDWLTCKDMQFGYEIRYPNDWFVITGESGPVPMPIFSKACKQGMNFSASEENYPINRGHITLRKLESPYAGYISNEEYLLDYPDAKTIYISEQEAVWLRSSEMEYELVSYQDAVVWHILITGKDRDFVDTVLSSIRFLQG